ncbi:MAG TPA: glucose 1-dehydrogenase [Solirubrobacteraceae bacterium]|nr:glucose 1-dehydrogenase [Solirubrobacteraceae bacterium]
MRAITLEPGVKDSADLEEVPEPPVDEGAVLVDGVALGICGTDAEIVRGDYGEAPPGAERLILGHESLGRVAEARDGSGFAAGDLVVGIVRRPDPVPCPSCAAGEWDFCRNGRYTERGIKALHGYGSERWRIEPEFAVKLDPGLGSLGVLMEPTTVVAKAWEQIDRVLTRATLEPERVLVTGAGPIGLLAALLARRRGYELTVLDLATEGPKPELVHDLGGSYHSGPVKDVDPPPDIVVEATGVSQVVLDAMSHNAPNGVVCLTGISSGGHEIGLDAGDLNRRIVLENDLVFGSVNANRRHYEAAAKALADADNAWLERLITRRVPLDRWREALTRDEHDIKVVVELSG